MVTVKLKDDSRAKHKAISGRLSDYSGFKLIENCSVKSVENDCCMTCHNAFAYHGSNTSLIYDLQHAHPILAFLFVTKMNYSLIVNFQKVNY